MNDPRTRAVPGLALLCSPDGTILRVLQNDFGPALPVATDTLFTRWVDEGSVDKAGTLLNVLVQERLATGWELNLVLGDAVETLTFMGACVDDSLLLMGAQDQTDLMRLFDEMSEVCNDQINRFRNLLYQCVLPSASAGLDHFDELSRLNNELANTHRELVNKNRELVNKNRELERLNEQKNRFLGMAAHDLRNPLDVIKTYSAFLEQDLVDTLNPEQREFLGAIRTSSEFMLGLINDLLDVTKIEAGKLTLEPVSLDLGPRIRENVHRNQVIAQKKQIRIECVVPDDLPPVKADPQKIEQVLNNLISNAVKYSHAGSPVRVVVEARSDRLAVAIVDQGQGIAAGEMKKLFQPFTTTETRSTAGEKSTGLGLMIVKRIVEGHGGEIQVKSEAGHGSTFTVLLPVDQEAPLASNDSIPTPADRTAADAPPDPDRDRPPLRILIAEDSRLNQTLMRRILERLKYGPDIVENGQEALDALAARPYDLVLLDMNMPVLGGLETARRIRSGAPTAGPTPRLLALTADTSDEAARACREAGMDGLITKPVDLKVLEAELKRTVSRTGSNPNACAARKTD